MGKKVRTLVAVLLLIATVPFLVTATPRFHPRWQPSDEIGLMTINVRTSRLSVLDFPNLWLLRKFVLAKIILAEKPEIIALQEATESQTRWFLAAFPDYSLISRSSDDQQWEYPTLLVRKDRFLVKYREREWFSVIPEIPNSVSWGNKKPRSYLSAELVDTFTKRRLAVASVHLDYQSENSRSESIADLAEWERTQQDPVILMGDFNETPTNERMSRLIHNPPMPTGFPNDLVDAYRQTNRRETGTLNGYRPKATHRIDLILVSPEWNIKSCRVITRRWKGIYPSDHYPVVARIAWPQEPLKMAANMR